MLMRRWVTQLPDRKYLENQILPALRDGAFRKIVFVGTEIFTRDYGQHFIGTTTEYWTTDSDPHAAIYGEPNRHITCDVRELDRHFPAGSLDVVLLNGVFGFGVNDRPDMERTIIAIHNVLKPDGILMIGWNPGRIEDPTALKGLRDLFQHESSLALPNRIELQSFGGNQHVYDFHRAH